MFNRSMSIKISGCQFYNKVFNFIFIIFNQLNKKVLLRERKKHTARRVASTRHTLTVWVPPCPDLDGEGYPILVMGGEVPQVPPILTWDLDGGYSMPGYCPHQQDGVPPLPIQTWHGKPPSSAGWGTPPSPDLGWGTPPSRPGMGYSPIWTWDGIPPRPGMGYPPPRPWMGYPPPRPGIGYTPTNGEQTDIPKYKYYLPSYYVRGR